MSYVINILRKQKKSANWVVNLPVPRVKKGKWFKERERRESGRRRKKRSDTDQPSKPKHSIRKFVLIIVGAIVIVLQCFTYFSRVF